MDNFYVLLPDFDLLPVEPAAEVGYFALREVVVGREEEGRQL